MGWLDRDDDDDLKHTLLIEISLNFIAFIHISSAQFKPIIVIFSMQKGESSLLDMQQDEKNCDMHCDDDGDDESDSLSDTTEDPCEDEDDSSSDMQDENENEDLSSYGQEEDEIQNNDLDEKGRESDDDVLEDIESRPFDDRLQFFKDNLRVMDKAETKMYFFQIFYDECDDENHFSMGVYTTVLQDFSYLECMRYFYLLARNEEVVIVNKETKVCSLSHCSVGYHRRRNPASSLQQRERELDKFFNTMWDLTHYREPYRLVFGEDDYNNDIKENEWKVFRQALVDYFICEKELFRAGQYSKYNIIV